MAKIKPKRKKEPLDPEIALTAWEKTVDYLRTNIRQIGAIALVVLVIGASIGAWIVSRTHTEQKALTLFAEALAYMDQKAGQQDDNATLYNAAMEKFTAIQKQYPSTKAGTASLFYAGVCCFHLKKYDDAILYYKKFVDAAGSDLQYLRSFAYEGLGYAHEMKNDYAEAITWFERQKKEGHGGVNGMAMLNLARCYEAKGDTNTACSLYKDFLEQQPESSFSDLVKLKTSTLCTKSGTSTS